MAEWRNAAEWLKPGRLAAAGPVDGMQGPCMPDPIATGLAFCIVEAPEQPGARIASH